MRVFDEDENGSNTHATAEAPKEQPNGLLVCWCIHLNLPVMERDSKLVQIGTLLWQARQCFIR